MSKVKNELLNVYDTKDDKYIFEQVDRKTIMDYFGVTSKFISERLAHDYKIQHRYLLERSINAEEIKKQWDEVRFKLNPSAKR